LAFPQAPTLPYVSTDEDRPERPGTRPTDTGPWDATLVPDQGLVRSRHSLEVTVDLVGARFSVEQRFLHHVGLSMASGDVPDSVVLTAASGTSLSVSVLAEPASEQRWASGLAQDTADALLADLADIPEASGATVSVVEGPVGLEIHATDRGGTPRVVRIGADGPRWCAVVSCTGQCRDEDLDAARGVLASMVVYRGPEPLAPDSPLSMQLMTTAGLPSGI
jgi:hypothetical protein